MIPKVITMDSTENSTIRIPLTLGHLFWLWLLLLIAAALALAALVVWDDLILFALVALIFPGFWIGGWIGRSPGKIEFTSDDSYYVRSRNEKFPWIYNGDNWEKCFPTSFHLQLINTGFRWSNGRLEIITSERSIFLGSGEKMLPIRDWLFRHGMQPK